MTIVFRRNRRGRDTGRRGEGHGKVEAEVGGLQPQATERQGPPEAGGSKGSPLEAWRERRPAGALISAFQLLGP